MTENNVSDTSLVEKLKNGISNFNKAVDDATGTGTDGLMKLAKLNKIASKSSNEGGNSLENIPLGPRLHRTTGARRRRDGWSFAGVKRAPEPRRRAEGVYLAQLTCGRARCSFRISVRVDGPLEVSLAAHRPAATTEALENLRRDLPPWAVGAEWGKFVSELVLRSV